MAEEPLLRGRTYLMRVGTTHGSRDGRADQVQARRRHARAHRGDAARPERDRRRQRRARASRSPSTRTSTTATPAASSSSTGSRTTRSARGCCVRALPRSENVRLEELVVDREARAGLKAQRPFVVWLTGRPGAGKSSIANALEARLFASGRHTVPARRREPAPRALEGPRASATPTARRTTGAPARSRGS